MPETADRPAPETVLRELAGAVRAADPAAFLVPGRILRRVIRELVDLPGLGLTIPHRKTWVIRRDDLLRLVERGELGLRADEPVEDPVLLVGEPSEEALTHLSAAELRRRAWRLVFHSRVHAELERRIGDGKLPASAVRARIDRIGQTAFDEVRVVLRQEDLLVPPRTDRAVYVEFAAFFLDLTHFAPNLLPHYFPDIAAPERVLEVLAEDVDPAALLAATRPPGAPDPDAIDLSHEARRREQADLAARAEPPRRPHPRRHGRNLRRAERAAAGGNSVRAAIYFRRAANRAPEGGGEEERASAAREIERLLVRLKDALSLPMDELADWSEGLHALLRRTGAKVWTREARTLYDLQKVCVDHERGIFTIDPVEWALTFGRRPIRRWLPSEREVLMNRHLRSARRRLPALHLPPDVHARFTPVLDRALAAAEGRLRDTFRPRIPAVFREVGLVPGNLPERMAMSKLTEELLDLVVARGRLRMGDVRDAISRNQLKLPDVRNPLAVLRRDPLLRADRKLAVTLDGVYRRAEFYLRWLQRFSALALGTAVGRFATKYLAIPFGGAFVVLEGSQHIVNPVLGWTGRGAVHLVSLASVLILGAFLFGLVHLPPFRRQVWEGIRGCFRVLRAIAVSVPEWLVRLPFVKRLLESRPFLIAMRFLVKPALYSALLFGVLRLFGSEAPGSARDAVVVFLAAMFLVNIPAGRRLEEITYDRMARNLHRFRVRVLAGLYHLVVGFFRDVLDAIDRLLYSVDEWLRFRSGESRLSLVLKPLAGVVWYFVSYLIRIYTTLLIEPQVNPIKHFPVVTVSHKMTLPFAVPLTKLLATPLKPLGPVVSNTIAGTTVLLMPGVFGFLVWELKENWKLFAKNRPRRLKPVHIGHHGETMLRLMKPGFHSGTLPKLFARLRRAERKSWRVGSGQRIRKLTSDLHHVEEAIHRFTTRDLLPLFQESAGGEFSVGHVRLGSNSLRVPIRREGTEEEPLVLSFEEQSGWLVATVSSPGWLASVRGSERAKVRNALVVVYKRAGVEIVREQVVAALDDGRVAWDIADEGLVVWPGRDWDAEIVYPLDESGLLRPSATAGRVPEGFTPLPARALLFSESHLEFREWVSAWADGDEGAPPPLLPAVRVLPE